MEDKISGNTGPVWAVKCYVPGSLWYTRWIAIECYDAIKVPLGKILEVKRRPKEN